MKPRTRLPRCPKCHKHPCTYMDYIESYTEWRMDENNILIPVWSAWYSTGPEVRALCGCGHEWVLRGVDSLSEIEGLPL